MSSGGSEPLTALPDDFWESRFQQDRTPWERGEINPAFHRWRTDGSLTPCRILVPGAGRSPEARALLDAGFDVTALDLANSAVIFQAERLGATRSVQADVTIWEPEQPFDAVYDQTCLCALPPALWSAYEGKLRRWLRHGGKLFMLFMQAKREGGPPFHCPIPEMRSLFKAWSWPDALGEPSPHGLGSEFPAILTRK